MKILIVVCVMLICFFIGIGYKKKYQEKYNFLIYLKNFATFLKSNLNLFKVNLVEIIDNFTKLQVDKNIKFNDIFIKNNEVYEFSKENLDLVKLNIEDSNIIFTFLSSIGKNEYFFEEEKINNFITFLDKKTEEYSSFVRTKGDLTLKLAIAIGCVISIIIW